MEFYLEIMYKINPQKFIDTKVNDKQMLEFIVKHSCLKIFNMILSDFDDWALSVLIDDSIGHSSHEKSSAKRWERSLSLFRKPFSTEFLPFHFLEAMKREMLHAEKKIEKSDTLP